LAKGQQGKLQKKITNSLVAALKAGGSEAELGLYLSNKAGGRGLGGRKVKVDELRGRIEGNDVRKSRLKDLGSKALDQFKQTHFDFRPADHTDETWIKARDRVLQNRANQVASDLEGLRGDLNKEHDFYTGVKDLQPEILAAVFPVSPGGKQPTVESVLEGYEKDPDGFETRLELAKAVAESQSGGTEGLTRQGVEQYLELSEALQKKVRSQISTGKHGQSPGEVITHYEKLDSLLKNSGLVSDKHKPSLKAAFNLVFDRALSQREMVNPTDFANPLLNALAGQSDVEQGGILDRFGQWIESTQGQNPQPVQPSKNELLRIVLGEELISELTEMTSLLPQDLQPKLEGLSLSDQRELALAAKKEFSGLSREALQLGLQAGLLDDTPSIQSVLKVATAVKSNEAMKVKLQNALKQHSSGQALTQALASIACDELLTREFAMISQKPGELKQLKDTVMAQLNTSKLSIDDEWSLTDGSRQKVQELAKRSLNDFRKAKIAQVVRDKSVLLDSKEQKALTEHLLRSQPGMMDEDGFSKTHIGQLVQESSKEWNAQFDALWTDELTSYDKEDLRVVLRVLSQALGHEDVRKGFEEGTLKSDFMGKKGLLPKRGEKLTGDQENLLNELLKYNHVSLHTKAPRMKARGERIRSGILQLYDNNPMQNIEKLGNALLKDQKPDVFESGSETLLLGILNKVKASDSLGDIIEAQELCLALLEEVDRTIPPSTGLRNECLTALYMTLVDPKFDRKRLESRDNRTSLVQETAARAAFESRYKKAKEVSTAVAYRHLLAQVAKQADPQTAKRSDVDKFLTTIGFKEEVLEGPERLKYLANMLGVLGEAQKWAIDEYKSEAGLFALDTQLEREGSVPELLGLLFSAEEQWMKTMSGGAACSLGDISPHFSAQCLIEVLKVKDENGAPLVLVLDKAKAKEMMGAKIEELHRSAEHQGLFNAQWRGRLLSGSQVDGVRLTAKQREDMTDLLLKNLVGVEAKGMPLLCYSPGNKGALKEVRKIHQAVGQLYTQELEKGQGVDAQQLEAIVRGVVGVYKPGQNISLNNAQRMMTRLLPEIRGEITPKERAQNFLDQTKMRDLVQEVVIPAVVELVDGGDKMRKDMGVVFAAMEDKMNESLLEGLSKPSEVTLEDRTEEEVGKLAEGYVDYIEGLLDQGMLDEQSVQGLALNYRRLGNRPSQDPAQDAVAYLQAVRNGSQAYAKGSNSQPISTKLIETYAQARLEVLVKEEASKDLSEQGGALNLSLSDVLGKTMKSGQSESIEMTSLRAGLAGLAQGLQVQGSQETLSTIVQLPLGIMMDSFVTSLHNEAKEVGEAKSFSLKSLDEREAMGAKLAGPLAQQILALSAGSGDLSSLEKEGIKFALKQVKNGERLDKLTDFGAGLMGGLDSLRKGFGRLSPKRKSANTVDAKKPPGKLEMLAAGARIASEICSHDKLKGLLAEESTKDFIDCMEKCLLGNPPSEQEVYVICAEFMATVLHDPVFFEKLTGAFLDHSFSLLSPSGVS
jgi:hypothetical protein